MIIRTGLLIASIIIPLAACSGSGKDYESAMLCEERGLAPGSEEYDNCLKEEKVKRLDRQQQELEHQQEMRRRQEMLLKY